ncbi:unnamed protein product, partial [Brassica rapa subsp. trilocularis]
VIAEEGPSSFHARPPNKDKSCLLNFLFLEMSSPETSHLATAKTALTAVASVAAAAMLARTVIQDYMPAEVHDFVSCGIRKCFSHFGFQMTVVIEEFGGFENNQVFEAAEAYLASKISPSTRRIKVNKLEKQRNFSVTVERDEEVVDTFDGVKLSWVLVCLPVKKKDFRNPRDLNSTLKSEVRSYELRFNKKFKKMVLESYLPFVVEQAALMKQKTKTLKIFTLVAEMVDAVVTVCLEKALNILEEKGRVVSEYNKQLKDLQDELQYMQSFLKDAERQKRTNDVLRKLVSDLRELVYEAEDILVDCQLADGNEAEDDNNNNEQRPSNAWLSRLYPARVSLQYKKSKRLKEINEKITSIKTKVEPYFKFRTPSNVGRDNGTDRWSSPVYDHTQVVGLEGDKRKIKEWLFNSKDSELLMMAFVGMGGLGKTTIAQEVFNDKEIENCFERRIWVSVSQTFTEEQIMRSILRNLGDASVGDDLGTLLRKIQQYLMGKRYLIVMDDVWDKNLSWWDKIHQGLPRGQGGSVIVTTRSESVAVKVQAREKTHRPELLSADNSWLLFCKVAFAANNGVCERSELEDVGKEIVTKCKGLPLTIKAVGGLLLCKDHVYHEWKRISEYFQDELRGNTSETDNVMSSLQLSYDELPSHLKSCFLTLSLYPEDCVIPKQQLVHGWIGEGFVMLRNGRSATESGEDCFSGLTNRCLVEVVDKTYSGTIVTCKIHDMVRDLVIDIAKNDSFSNSEGLNCRHIGISGNFEEKQVRVNHRLRGLVSTTKTGEVNKLNSELAKKFTDCKYLRVLDISKSIFDAPLSDILDEIASLKNLACLSMSNTHPLIQLPRSMEDLQNLQILDASYCQNLKQLQPCIVLFKKLLVLDMTNCGSLEYFPKGIGSLGNLEVLLGFKPSMSSNGCKLSEVRNLTNLRKLGLSLTRGDQIEEDELDSLVNLSKLMLLSINCYDSYGDDLITKIDALTPPHQLHELSLEFYPGKLSPSWLSPKRLPMLRYMSICSGNLAKMHQIFWETETNTHWRIEALMFHSLSELEMDWEELQLSMPYLRTVHANWCPELETFPIEDVGFRGGVWTKTPTHRT